MDDRMLILGAGSHGRIVLDILVELDKKELIAGFVDVYENERIHGRLVSGIPIVGGIDILDEAPYNEIENIALAFGDNLKRKGLYDIVNAQHKHLVNVIHPRATISRNAQLGKGISVCAGAVISTDSVIGTGCIINTAATVDHDNKIGDFVHISPGVNLAGNVTVGDYTWVGIGSCAKEGIKIGRNVLIGAGSVVVNNIPDNVICYGVPAEIIDKQKIQIV